MSESDKEPLPCYRVIVSFDEYNPTQEAFMPKAFHVRYWAADKFVRAYLMVASDCPNGQVVKVVNKEHDPFTPCFSEN